MRAMEIQGDFGIDNLKLAERETTKAGPGDLSCEVMEMWTLRKEG